MRKPVDPKQSLRTQKKNSRKTQSRMHGHRRSMSYGLCSKVVVQVAKGRVAMASNMYQRVAAKHNLQPGQKAVLKGELRETLRG